MTQALGPKQQALVAALRSGKYEQASGCLRKKTGFCCLGVAADLVKVMWDPAAELIKTGGKRLSPDFSGLSDEIIEEYGFRSPEGKFEGRSEEVLGSTHNTLSMLNDSGWSFAQIADFLERRAGDIFTEPK